MKSAAPMSGPVEHTSSVLENEKHTFDPRVLVFACNWCSYAGADTAGVSRFAQTPHFRMLRVMCSGRVHPAFVLRAFARGADGVMVSGCHFGDCHYMFGNYRAAEQYEKTQALVHMLGLEQERIRLEWISAAEGIRFANIVNEFVEAVRACGPSPIAPAGPTEVDAEKDEPSSGSSLLQAARIFSCLECGRCTAICPVAPYQAFSPRRLISQSIATGLEALARDPSLWACLTCGRCQAVCPVQIDYPHFILAARAAAVAAMGGPPLTPDIPEQDGEPKPSAPRARPQAPEAVVPCSHGGVFEQISIMHTRPGLRQQRLGWLTDDMQASVLEDGAGGEIDDLLFVGCSPYFATYFGGETGEGLTRTMRAVIRLLNRVGIRPALLANERCCGYHMRLAGRKQEADKLETLVVEQIRQSGARRVITFCPECLAAFQNMPYHKRGFDVVHLSEILAPKREDLRRGAAESGAGHTMRVTFQDPCRLGRHAGIYDAPRQLIEDVAGNRVVEMAHSRAQAICCGNTAWLNCNAGTKQLQLARLGEAVATGSQQLITACPGCFIHLRCAQEGTQPATPQGEAMDTQTLQAASQSAPGTQTLQATPRSAPAGIPAAQLEIIDLWDLLEKRLSEAGRKQETGTESQDGKGNP